jgi:inner membrane protein involved in colicin E2 resistance
MTISLENRAHVIVACNRGFIDELPGISPGARKVYYKYESFVLTMPDWFRFTGADDSEIVRRSLYRPVHVFGTNFKEAHKFVYGEVYNEARNLELQIGIPLTVENMGEEWLPF